MPASFLHGVETIEIQKGPRPIRAVKSAVIGLIGTAPVTGMAKPNEPVLILNETDAARYMGVHKPGYTIPKALKSIFDQGGAQVIALNMFEEAKAVQVESDIFSTTPNYLYFDKNALPEGVTYGGEDITLSGITDSVVTGGDWGPKDGDDRVLVEIDTDAATGVVAAGTYTGTITIGATDYEDIPVTVKTGSGSVVMQSGTDMSLVRIERFYKSGASQLTYKKETLSVDENNDLQINLSGANVFYKIYTTPVVKTEEKIIFGDYTYFKANVTATGITSETKISGLSFVYEKEDETDETVNVGDGSTDSFEFEIIDSEIFIKVENFKIPVSTKGKTLTITATVGTITVDDDTTEFLKAVSDFSFKKGITDPTNIVVEGYLKDDSENWIEEELEASKHYVVDYNTPGISRLYKKKANGEFDLDDATFRKKFAISDLTPVTVTYNIGNPEEYIAPGDGGEPVINDKYLQGDGDDIRKYITKFQECYTTFGFFPKILIAPGFCENQMIAAKLVAVADKLRAVTLLDSPKASDKTVAEMRASFFDTSSERALYCYPYVNAGTEKDPDHQPYSQYLAGAMAAKDLEKGYWWSPSNTEIKGITGMSKDLTAMINDPNSEVNLLNSNGIVTIFKSFGTGYRVWGNRSASYPASTATTNFINIRRTADILHESVEYAMLQFIDMPINNALIDSIAESVNSFMRTLIGRGALVDGKCLFDPAKNEATEMAAGHITFDIEFMPPAPAERISFESFINVKMLENLGG